MKTIRLYTLVLLSLVPMWVLSATYYCSPSGSGDGSSYSKPCSLQNGLNKLQNPGDTLYLLGGQYNVGKTQVPSISGSPSKRIVIAGVPGETAILDFRTTPYGTRGLQISSSSQYLHIRHLTLRYSGKNNLYNEGSYCLFEDLDIYGSSDTGCQMKKGGNNIILNVDSHDNFDYQQMRSGPDGQPQVDFGGNADGFADKQHAGAPNHYIGCRSWNNSDDGWDFFARETKAETIIEYCICYQNGPAEYDMRNHPRYETDKAWFDQFVNGKQMEDRYGQPIYVTLDHYPNVGNGNGFKMGGNYTDHPIVVHHCLAVANTVKGIDQNNNDGRMRIENNTCYDNGNNYGFTTSYGSVRLNNNLSYRSRRGDSYAAAYVEDNSYNSWNGLTVNNNDFVSLDTTRILQPRQADGSLQEMTLLHPTANSALIDCGKVLTYIYYGQAPEVGCYEYITGEPHDPTPGPEPEYECYPGAFSIAYVTMPDAEADRPMLTYLRRDTVLCVEVINAAETDVDYSDYDMVLISSVPNSTAAGFQALKDLDKPRLILKPFLYKASVWNWATPANTNLDAMQITDPTHPIFRGLTSPLKVFNRVSTNGVTTATDWLVSPVTTLATVNGKDAIALYANTLTIGLSEYSTAYITDAGLQLLRNSVYYLLGETPGPLSGWESTPRTDTEKAIKVCTPNGLQILRNGVTYTLTGQQL